MKLIIVHLTDLHANFRIIHGDNKIASIIDILRQDAFSNNILFLFSGDISQSGKQEQYAVASSFLEKIKNELVKEGKRVYFSFCPGNHDRDFGDSEEMKPEFVSLVDTDNYLTNYDNYSYLQKNYIDFEEKSENFKRLNKILGLYSFKIDDNLINVYTLNNTLLSSYVRTGKKSTESQNITLPYDLLKIKRKNEDYSFLLMHMPFGCLSSKTRNYLKDSCNKNIDLVFDGHVHEGSVTIRNDGYAEVTSSALYSNEMSGFILLHLNKNKVQSFVYIFDKNDDAMKYRRDAHACTNVDFRPKTSTLSGFDVNKESIDRKRILKLKEGIDLDIDDLFVFPSLSESRYMLNKQKKHIESFDKFLEHIKGKVLVNIIGDESIGKTTLARQLFYLFIKNGKSPLLVDGGLLDNKKTSKPLKERILYQANDSYTNKNIGEDYFEIEKSDRILLIDNFDFVSTPLLEECSNLFDKVIFFTDEDVSHSFTLSTFPGLTSTILNIEPLFRSKREEMCERIYSALCEIKPEIRDNITCEKYILAIEKMVDKMDIGYLIDPSSLLDISVKTLLQLEIFTSGKNLSYLKNHYKYLIERAISSKKYEKCTPIMVERMLADIAYHAYESKKNELDLNDFQEALDREIKDYETTPFNNVQNLIDLLLSEKFIKISQINQSCYQFYSMKVFAFYTGKYAMMMHNEQNEEPFKTIISRGIYSKLNFDILMSVAYSYDMSSIPNYFVQDLYDEICNKYTFKLRNLDGIKIYFSKEKKRVAKIDEDEKRQIRERISEQESKERDEYIANVNNYYYEKTVDSSVKELIELSNKNQIVASLLNSSDLLKGPQKSKLIKLAITLPNITIDKYVSYVKEKLDEFYIKLLDEIEKEKDSKKSNNMISIVDSFFDSLLSLITATILVFYDNGARPLNNPIMNEKLREALKGNNGDCNFQMPDIQRLMLLSFSNNEAEFTNEMTQYLDDEKDPYKNHFAALIAKRYCVDNYESLKRKKSPFLSKIQGIFGSNVLIEANKKNN